MAQPNTSKLKSTASLAVTLFLYFPVISAVFNLQNKRSCIDLLISRKRQDFSSFLLEKLHIKTSIKSYKMFFLILQYPHEKGFLSTFNTLFDKINAEFGIYDNF